MSQKYRICLISRSTLAHKRGGLERYAQILGSALAEAGHDVTMLTSAHPLGIELENHNGVKMYYVSDTVPGSYKGGFFVKSAKKFFELHAQNPFDIIHSQSYGAMGILKKVSEPVIATFHGVWFSETVFEKDAFHTLSPAEKVRHSFSFPKIFFHHMAMHGFAKHANKIIFDSVFSKKEFRHLHPSWDERKFAVVSAAVDVNCANLPPKEEARRILGLNGNARLFSLSRLETTKGFQTALRAVRGLPAVYLLGGEGKYGGGLAEMCRDENIENVVFLGHVGDEKLPLYYKAADIFIYPELVHPAFGLSVAEAMACGACVVAARRGALPEVVGDAGVLYAHNDPRELKDILLDLLHHPEKREALGTKAQERIKTYFTKEIMLEKIVSVYDEVLSGEK